MKKKLPQEKGRFSKPPTPTLHVPVEDQKNKPTSSMSGQSFYTTDKDVYRTGM